jgi:putative membrane protein
VAGLGVAQLLPPFRNAPWGREIIATPLILLGAAMSILSYLEWKGNQEALRRGTALARSQLPRVLAVTIFVVALLAGAVDLYSRATGH